MNVLSRVAIIWNTEHELYDALKQNMYEFHTILSLFHKKEKEGPYR
jgi:hypothetical protein